MNRSVGTEPYKLPIKPAVFKTFFHGKDGMPTLRRVSNDDGVLTNHKSIKIWFEFGIKDGETVSVRLCLGPSVMNSLPALAEPRRKALNPDSSLQLHLRDCYTILQMHITEGHRLELMHVLGPELSKHYFQGQSQEERYHRAFPRLLPAVVDATPWKKQERKPFDQKVYQDRIKAILRNGWINRTPVATIMGDICGEFTKACWSTESKESLVEHFYDAVHHELNVMPLPTSLGGIVKKEEHKSFEEYRKISFDLESHLWKSIPRPSLLQGEVLPAQDQGSSGQEVAATGQQYSHVTRRGRRR